MLKEINERQREREREIISTSRTTHLLNPYWYYFTSIWQHYAISIVHSNYKEPTIADLERTIHLKRKWRIGHVCQSGSSCSVSRWSCTNSKLFLSLSCDLITYSDTPRIWKSDWLIIHYLLLQGHENKNL